MRGSPLLSISVTAGLRRQLLPTGADVQRENVEVEPEQMCKKARSIRRWAAAAAAAAAAAVAAVGFHFARCRVAGVRRRRLISFK